MNERYVVTSRRGEPAVRTDELPEAERWQRILRGEVIDREAVTA